MKPRRQCVASGQQLAHPTRRDVLRASLAGAGGAVLLPAFTRLPDMALAAPPAVGKLTDIDHVVIVIQENRSFDHYFGTYPGVRGFSDPHPIPGIFSQAFAKNSSVPPVGRILPYHLDTSSSGGGECTPDPTHGWGPQHQSWHRGANDAWGPAHAADADWSFMGYYTRADLPYYHAVADAFTLCDAYHCSVLGSTTSNRLYTVSAWLDPHGIAGGPVKSTITWDPTSRGTLSWTTYPERLTAKGISWTAYSSPDADSQENPLVDFRRFYPGAPGFQPAYAEAVFGHNFADFLADAAAGNLPQVSWVLTSIVQDEHPSGAPHDGEVALQSILAALTSNAASWARTVVFYTYDENGGFFDHVSPPTAPPGTPGEYCTGDAVPIGLGYRVPMLVLSPFSRGGFVARDVFDHTSVLRFLETRFGVEVPNLTAWRRSATGDLTSALNFAAVDTSIPALPAVLPTTFVDHPECLTEEVSMGASPTPAAQSLPVQERGTRPSPSGLVCRPVLATALPARAWARPASKSRRKQCPPRSPPLLAAPGR